MDYREKSLPASENTPNEQRREKLGALGALGAQILRQWNTQYQDNRSGLAPIERGALERMDKRIAELQAKRANSEDQQ